MRILPGSYLLVVATLYSIIAPANAFQSSPRDVVRAAEVQQAQLLARVPRLAAIDAATRDDCAAKNPRFSRDSSFCGCAAAIMMGIWRSAIDPQMTPRLLDFANGRGDATAQYFLAYQGPELYRPICSRGASR